MDLDLSDVLVRLLAAAAAGGLVGLNRDLADKPIGVRTGDAVRHRVDRPIHEAEPQR